MANFITVVRIIYSIGMLFCPVFSPVFYILYLTGGLSDMIDGQFYRACEKLFQLMRQNGADVQNHLFEGRHSGDYIKSNMETYLRFYS